MSGIKNIENLFDQGNIEKCLELLNKFLEKSNIPVKEKIYALETKFKIFTLQQLSCAEFLPLLIELEINEGRFDEAYEKYSELLAYPTRHNIKILSLGWDINIGIGRIEEALKYGVLILRELKDLKRYHEILKFLIQFEKFGGSKNLVKQFKIFAIVGIGDKEELDKLFSENKLQFRLSNKNLKENMEIYELFIEVTAKNGKYWKDTVAYSQIKILHAFTNLLDLKYRKTLINQIFDRILMSPREKIWYQFLIKYCEMLTIKKLGLKTIKFLRSNAKILDIKHGFLKNLKILEEDLETYPDKKEVMDKEDIDLGYDLFKSYKNEENVFERIKNIERDITFIKSTSSSTALERLYSELKSLDPDNELLKDYYYQEYSDSGSYLNQRKKSSKEIELNLLEELNHFSDSLGTDINIDKKGYVRGCCKFIDLLKEEDFKENVGDYFIAFYWIELPEVCLYLIDKYLSTYVNIPLTRFLELSYMKVEALISMGKNHEASDLCEEIINKKPLVEMEKVNVVYLLGEVSLKLNRRKKAYSAYKWVEGKCPNYRLVKSRLKNIEKC